MTWTELPRVSERGRRLRVAGRVRAGAGDGEVTVTVAGGVRGDSCTGLMIAFVSSSSSSSSSTRVPSSTEGDDTMNFELREPDQNEQDGVI